MKIVAAIHDLMFSSKVNAAAGAAGRSVSWLPRGTPIADYVAAEKPDVLLVDLGNQKLDPINAIRAIKSAEATRHVVVIGYLNHELEELIALAKEAGCDRVLAKGAFARQLPELLA